VTSYSGFKQAYPLASVYPSNKPIKGFEAVADRYQAPAHKFELNSPTLSINDEFRKENVDRQMNIGVKITMPKQMTRNTELTLNSQKQPQ
jgi:hypothetical protein